MATAVVQEHIQYLGAASREKLGQAVRVFILSGQTPHAVLAQFVCVPITSPT